MAWEVSRVCIEFLYFLLLLLFGHIINFTECCRVNLLLLQVGRQFEFVFLEVVLSLLDVKGIIHYLQIDLQVLRACLLLLEVAEG